MEVLAKQSNLNKITLEALLEYIRKNCCNKQQYLEEIVVDDNIDIEEIKITSQNFKQKLKSSEQAILFCPTFIKNFDYFKLNQDILIFNINSLDLSPTLSVSSKKSNKDYDNIFKSLFLSILYCFCDIKELNDKSLDEFIVNTNKHVQIADFTKLNIKKTVLNKNLKTHKITLEVLRFISDYLHINIFLFDFKLYENKVIYCSGDFIPYKKNILLYLDDESNCYYPLITNNFKTFKYDQSIFKYFLSDTSNIITYDNTDFKLTIDENLDCYINKEVSMLIEENMKIPINFDDVKETTSVINGFDDNYSPTEKEINSDNNSNDSSDDENIDKEDNSKIEKYMTYSLKDLQKLAKDKNIDIKNKVGKFKTKKELIDNLI
jgi:hypothetical protein